MNNEMKGHMENCVEQTIQIVVKRIADLQDLVKGLQGLRDATAAEVMLARVTAPAAAAPPPPPATRRYSRKPIGASRTGDHSRPKRRGRGGSNESPTAARELEAAAGFFSPFKIGQFAAAAKVDEKRAANVLNKWTRKGWVRRVTRGEFEITKQFPKTAAPAPVLLPGEEEMTTAQKLQQALEDRKTATGTLARILDDKIVRLQAELNK